MSTITITKLYDLISIKLGKETAENLTTFIENKIKSEVDTKASNLATKEDLARETGRISAEAASNKAELLKWMFVFWASQLIAMFGFVMLFMKK
jgi:hypothetical protein